MVHTPRNLPPPAELIEQGKKWTAWFRVIAGGSKKGDWAPKDDPRTEYKLVLRHALELRGQHALAEYDRTRFRNPTI
jgi:hypothetical protein